MSRNITCRFSPNLLWKMNGSWYEFRWIEMISSSCDLVEEYFFIIIISLSLYNWDSCCCGVIFAGTPMIVNIHRWKYFLLLNERWSIGRKKVKVVWWNQVEGGGMRRWMNEWLKRERGLLEWSVGWSRNLRSWIWRRKMKKKERKWLRGKGMKRKSVSLECFLFIS